MAVTVVPFQLTTDKLTVVDMGRLAGVCNSVTEMVTCCHTDWVHPTAEGYSRMADVWFNAIDSRLRV